MDVTPGVRQRKSSGRRPRSRGQRGANPQLFDDTSGQPGMYAPQQPEYAQQPGPAEPGMVYNPYTAEMYAPQDNSGYGPPPGSPHYSGQQFLHDPMANMAMQYGQDLAGQGKEYIHQHLDKYVSTSKLKYYFAVDTSYVGKKLGLLVFPFTHTNQDWSIKYNQEEPVAPRYEVNAPDLYIPVMAFVTYILLAGLMLGTQNRFTPEHLGITASTALVWMVIEIIILLLTMYILNVSTDLKYLDLLAYCGYKYVGMILSLLAGLLFKGLGYYLILLWTSISIAFFLARSLKMAIVPHSEADGFGHVGKRRFYVLLCIALSQPIFMWWLTYHLVFA